MSNEPIKPFVALPDYLTAYLNTLIKADKDNALRWINIHYKISQLLDEDPQINEPCWLYVDFINSDSLLARNYQELTKVMSVNPKIGKPESYVQFDAAIGESLSL